MPLSLNDLRYAFYGHSSSLSDAEYAYMLAAYNAGVTAAGIVGAGYVSAGSPEGVITAPVGSLDRDTTNGVIYVKQTGTGNTGWTAVGGGGGGGVASVVAGAGIGVDNTDPANPIVTNSGFPSDWPTPAASFFYGADNNSTIEMEATEDSINFYDPTGSGALTQIVVGGGTSYIQQLAGPAQTRMFYEVDDNGGNTLFGIQVDGNIRTAKSSAATIPGTVVKKLQIFDENGASLGFIPIYDAIT